MTKIKENRIRVLCKQVKKTCLVRKEGKVYEHYKTEKNPDYEKGLKSVPLFESCLIYDKGNSLGSSKSHPLSQKLGSEIKIRTTPKWLTEMGVFETDQEGYPVQTDTYFTDDLKGSNNRKIKTLHKFCDKYQPLYAQKKVTLFFLTFTAANKARHSWSSMLKIVRKYMERAGAPVLGWVWISEIGQKTYTITKDPKDLHWHYHLAFACPRLDLKGKRLHKLLKFENIWGCRTEINFVKKNIRGYMMKYFAKNNMKVEGVRSFGISRKLR
jgi:hypothetical protein